MPAVPPPAPATTAVISNLRIRIDWAGTYYVVTRTNLRTGVTIDLGDAGTLPEARRLASNHWTRLYAARERRRLVKWQGVDPRDLARLWRWGIPRQR